VTTAAIADGPGPDPAPPPPPDRGPGLRRELLIAAGVAVALAALGLPLGLLWRAVAPQVEFVMSEQGPIPVEQEPEGFMADDGWYVVITFAAGVVAAILVWVLLRRRRGPIVLVGLAVGAVVGGVLTAWLGRYIGYAHYRDLVAHAAVGTHFFRPPDVRSGDVGLWFGFIPRVQGAVLLEAVAAVTTYLLLASFHVEPDLRAPGRADPISWEPSAWPGPTAPPAPPGSGPAGPPPG